MNPDRHGAAAGKGKRLRGCAPHGSWRTLTIVGALRCDRLSVPCVFDSLINGVCFRAYVDQVILPTLAPDNIFVMDKLGRRKAKAVRDAIRAVGAREEFLPKYSSDLNPIPSRCGTKTPNADPHRPEKKR